MPDRFLITGGSGFIGSAYVKFLINSTEHEVLNLDKLTYASNQASLEAIDTNKRYRFIQADILDSTLIENIFSEFQPNFVVHLAAESHVDRSIADAGNFVNTNIVGTYVLLEASRKYWQELSDEEAQKFKFHHISTDEVFGSLPELGLFSESSPYDPSSPYSASKAASDHLVRSWYRTYGLPTLITNSSNNYGPNQFPEKLIPLTIMNALNEQPINIYGDGKNIRDWLYVLDHIDALYQLLLKGEEGHSYNIGGNNQKTNLEVVEGICNILDEILPRASDSGSLSYSDLITFVSDRRGHDFRYAIDTNKIENLLNWCPRENFASGLRKTVIWYIENQAWVANITERTKP
jgi:dTDP-glucose 4,6-dehydratase